MPDRATAMLCPLDGTTLVMSERQNIEIDYCPTCRGVWLDRGELDKIIERSSTGSEPAPRAPEPYQPVHQPRPTFGGHGYEQPYRKRKKSFLEEIFD